MDQYAVYIWAAYAVAAVVLIVMAGASLFGAHLADRAVAALRAASGRTSRRDRNGAEASKRGDSPTKGEAAHGG
ncbi:heme exporter protein CcmD [Fodinicurvata sp. EGI_FJ10296]|uniref:heme exporter protein CcmD n=1 Tax=Fodinicurvata sp. EGI_FJ10296 TaxID=3231908 RepID=UPI00345234B0